MLESQVSEGGGARILALERGCLVSISHSLLMMFVDVASLTVVRERRRHVLVALTRLTDNTRTHHRLTKYSI